MPPHPKSPPPRPAGPRDHILSCFSTFFHPTSTNLLLSFHATLSCATPLRNGAGKSRLRGRGLANFSHAPAILVRRRFYSSRLTPRASAAPRDAIRVSSRHRRPNEGKVSRIDISIIDSRLIEKRALCFLHRRYSETAILSLYCPNTWLQCGRTVQMPPGSGSLFLCDAATTKAWCLFSLRMIFNFNDVYLRTRAY